MRLGKEDHKNMHVDSMNQMDAVQNEIIDDFKLLEDPFDQYAYLLKLSSFLPVMPQEERDQCREVEGCQSHVWLKTWSENSLFYMDAESDTMIIRGLLYLIKKVVTAQPLSDVSVCELYFLTESGLVASLDADRRKGIGFIVKEIKARAGGLLEQQC